MSMNDSSISNEQFDHLLPSAIAQHQTGKLQEAEHLYRQILKHNLLHADANHNLGVLAMQAGQTDAALHHLELALLADRKNIQYAMTYTRALMETGMVETAALFISGSMLNTSNFAAVKDWRRELTQRGLLQSKPATPNAQKLRSLVQASKKTNASLKKKAIEDIQDDTFQRLKYQRILAYRKMHAFQELEKLTQHFIQQDPTSGQAWLEYADVLQQQDKPALTAYQEAAKLSAEDAEVICSLAHALTRNGQLQEAQQQFLRALTLDPQNPELHFEAGNLCTELAQWAEAEKHYESTLAIQPDHAKAHCNLGKCLQLNVRPDAAMSHYRMAIALDPQLSSAHHNLGLLLKSAGKFDLALQSLRTAVETQLQRLRAQDHSNPPATPIKRGRPAIKRAQAHLVLDTLRQLLSELKLDFCLFAGCALGIFREGELLAVDKDLDIAIHAGVDRARLLQHLLDSGQFRLHLQYHTDEERQHRYSMSVVHLASNISVDIFFLHADGDAHILAGAFHPAQALLCRLSRFEFSPCTWRGAVWNLPSNTALYLTQVYGENWRQPDPGFDTTLSNPSRIAAAMPAVLCYAYSRLCLYLQERDWTNSLAICLQIQARSQDQLLSELQTELQGWLILQQKQKETAK